MRYELGALIDSTRTVTVHSARTVLDAKAEPAALSAIALRTAVADSARKSAFEDVAIACQHLRHAGLLLVRDVIERELRPVAIAALEPGAPLSRLMLLPRRRKRRFGLVPSARLVLDVARALQVIHAARPDLRPLQHLSADTVWVTTRGRGVLLPSTRCSAPDIGSKPSPWSRYRAPECAGDADRPGDSADVYSLAVLLWDLLAAEKAMPLERSGDHTGQTPTWLDPDLVQLVMRSLSSDVSVRPRDPGAFAAELVRVLSRLEPALDPAVLPSTAADDRDDAVTIELPGRRAGPTFAVAQAPIRGAYDPAGPGEGPAAPRQQPDPRPPLDRAPKLKVVESTELPAVSELVLTNEPRRWVVGRAASAHLVVADPDMSREHFAVFWEGEGRYRVRDLGSKNGLFVNGKAATDSRLTPGDEVRAGGTRLRFEA